VQIPIEARVPSHGEALVVGATSLSSRSMGSNSFVLNSKSLSSQAAWQSSSSKVAVHRPRRLVNPSKFKLSPYMMPQSKIRVSRVEADLYKSVLKMAESSEHLK
jgi:hypothetical protein